MYHLVLALLLCMQVLWSECYLCKVDMSETTTNTISPTFAAMEKLVGKNENLQVKVEALQK